MKGGERENYSVQDHETALKLKSTHEVPPENMKIPPEVQLDQISSPLQIQVIGFDII